MENKNSIQEELINICPTIVQAGANNVYSVSASYFTNLAEGILQKTEAGTEPVYYFSARNPFIVPGNYFQNLPQNILQAVFSAQGKAEVFEEMEQISPLLNRISRKPVFGVPADYFNAAQPLPLDTEKPQAKIISLTMASRFLRYAAAAVIIVLAGIGIYMFTQKDPVPGQVNTVSAKVQVTNLSEEDIIDYLKTNTSDDVTGATAKTSANENDINRSVSKITDKEITEFLQENGDADEI